MRLVQFPQYWGLGGLLLLLLTAGCGDDKPVYYAPGNSQASSSPPVDPLAPSAPAATGAPDPLSSGTDPLISGGDPLTKGSRSASPDSSGDPMQGPKMPTQHSHWLTGHISNANVIVRLNGLRLGEFSNRLDKDITMKLRAGINTVTFDYTPLDTASTAHLDLLESEHDPPIAPLATFHSPRLAADAKPQEISQTFTFVAN